MSPSTFPVFDVAVLGAGPAGAAAALEATRRGRTVVLFERGDEHADKPCGEGVMPSGVETLRALGLDAAVRAGRPFPGIRHRVAGAGPLSIDLDAPGVAIRRPVLAAALDAALGDARGLVRLRASASGRPRPDGPDGGAFEIDAGPAGHFFARTLIACDGSGGRGAAWLQDVRRRGRPSQRFGVRARCRTGAPLDRVEVHMGRGCEIYLTPLPDDLVNVALLVERAPEGVAGAVALLAWGLARHPDAQVHLGAVVTPPGARALDGRRPRRASEAGAFLAGDAAGAVDPIVGCGVTIALRTGVAAARGADALLGGASPADVDRAYAATVRRERAARHALASLLRLGDAHPHLARSFVAVLRRAPRAARTLARIAAGR